jgi:hypothetical protein
MPRKKKKVWPVVFRDAAGKPGLTIPSSMTLRQCVEMGIEPRMVPKDEPRGPNTLVFDPEKDMPKDA